MTKLVQNALFYSSILRIHTAIHIYFEQIKLRNLVSIRKAAKHRAASLVSASSPWQPVRIAHTRAALEFYAIQMQQMNFYCRSYCLLNMFRGTIMPIIRSSRVLYKWLLSVLFGAWFSNCRYSVELRVVCSVCGQQQQYIFNRSYNLPPKSVWNVQNVCQAWINVVGFLSGTDVNKHVSLTTICSCSFLYEHVILFPTWVCILTKLILVSRNFF
jgi:hypothetical protein